MKRSTAETLTDLSQGGSFGVGKAHTGGKVSAEDAILGCEVFILEQELLIDEPGDVGQQPGPFVLWHEEVSSLPSREYFDYPGSDRTINHLRVSSTAE